MSLLEDIFLRDEADEAKELERIIEGDEYDEKPQRSDSDDNSEKEDEAEEEKKRVDPSTTKTKRAVRNPRFILNPARLTGPRGIQVIPDHFKDFKFKGKGHEKEDLALVLKKLEHWAYRLYPKFQFEDCLKKIETLGKKRPVMVHLHKIRSDQFVSEETVVQKDSSDEENIANEKEEDEFDKLLQQQIELARSTPGPRSVKKPALEKSFMDSSSITAPKATSSPSISDEQKERMMRNRKLAEERRLARLKNISILANNVENNSTSGTNNINEQSTEIIDSRIDPDEISNPKKHNRTNIIDSSDDDDDDIITVNESITVDIHTNVDNEVESSNHEIKQHKGNECNNSNFDSILVDDGEKNDCQTTEGVDDINMKASDKSSEISENLHNDNVSDVDQISENNLQIDETDNEVCETNIESSTRKEIPTNNIENIMTYNKESDNGNKSQLIKTDLLSEETNTKDNVTFNENSEKSRDIIKNIVDPVKDVTTASTVEETFVRNEEIDLGTKISNNLNDDLMDVDFTEEF